LNKNSMSNKQPTLKLNTNNTLKHFTLYTK